MKGCGGGLAPPTQEVGCVVVVGVWWNVIDILVCVDLAVLYYCQVLYSSHEALVAKAVRNKSLIMLFHLQSVEAFCMSSFSYDNIIPIYGSLLQELWLYFKVN